MKVYLVTYDNDFYNNVVSVEVFRKIEDARLRMKEIVNSEIEKDTYSPKLGLGYCDDMRMTITYDDSDGWTNMYGTVWITEETVQ